MKVVNLTKYDDKMIANMMRAAKVTDSGIINTLSITVNKRTSCAHVLIYEGTATIVLKSDNMDKLPSLAHELKHVAQVSHGLGEFMMESVRTDKHNERWHEIEAIEFSKRYV